VVNDEVVNHVFPLPSRAPARRIGPPPWHAAARRIVADSDRTRRLHKMPGWGKKTPGIARRRERTFNRTAACLEEYRAFLADHQ
jgi:hypothetical protein